MRGDLHEAGAGDEKCLTERLNGRRGFNIVGGGGSMGRLFQIRWNSKRRPNLSVSRRYVTLPHQIHPRVASVASRIQVLLLSQHAPAAARDCKHRLCASGARPADVIATLLSRHPGRQPSTRHFPRPTSTTRLQSSRTGSTPRISDPPSHSRKRVQRARTPRRAQARMRGSCIANYNSTHLGIRMMISVGPTM